MMTEQKDSFLIGYLFSDIERKFFKEAQKNPTIDEISGSILIPKVWFGFPHNVSDDFIKYTNTKIICVIMGLKEVLKDFLPKWERFNIEFSSQKQYICFDFTLYKKIRRKMTLEQIEEKLGYKIELIKEKKD